MTTPNKVIFANFRDRRSYEKALREQKKADCQGEQIVSPVMDGLQRIKAWLDAGRDPREACAMEANRSRGVIREEAKILEQCTTPVAAAAFLMKLAEQMMAKTKP